ncbi:MAG: hypothetical protein Q4C73_10715 [Eubacteriales bacterium]|nr:hypothetical protein [Eubacteriales bacterium]
MKNWKMKPERSGGRRKQTAITAAVAAALTAAVIAAAVYIINKDSLIMKEPVRVSMMGDNMDFYGSTRLRFNKEKKRVSLENDGRSLILQGVPVYCLDKKAVVLSQQMIYTNYETSTMKRVNYFARVEDHGQTMTISPDGRKEREIHGGYLYDGKNIYLFLEPVTVSWGSKSLSLDAMSYVAVFDKQGFYYYSCENEQAEYVESGDEIVSAQADTGAYSLNLSKDIVDIKGGSSLLLPPDPESFEVLK